MVIFCSEGGWKNQKYFPAKVCFHAIFSLNFGKHKNFVFYHHRDFRFLLCIAFRHVSYHAQQKSYEPLKTHWCAKRIKGQVLKPYIFTLNFWFRGIRSTPGVTLFVYWTMGFTRPTNYVAAVEPCISLVSVWLLHSTSDSIETLLVRFGTVLLFGLWILVSQQYLNCVCQPALRWGQLTGRRTCNPKVAGSNPAARRVFSRVAKVLWPVSA